MSSEPVEPTNSGRSILLVVSSPSGAGKTTLCHRLMTQFAGLRLSISCTTRAPRASEVDGRDYRFVAHEEFQAMVDRAEFVEWAEVHGNRYGTPRHEVEQAGTDVLFDIDWQGARALKEQYPADVILVLVLPPSMAELGNRLRRRGTDSEQAVQRRLAEAANEVARYEEYQYIVVNDDLEVACAELGAIYHARRCAIDRREHFARRLIDDMPDRAI
jgi:guanylate kinase